MENHASTLEEHGLVGECKKEYVDICKCRGSSSSCCTTLSAKAIKEEARLGTLELSRNGGGHSLQIIDQ
jgi:hypothetical protein